MIKKYLNRLKGRKQQVYCLGAAKTGTTSIAHMYFKTLRSAHEPLVKDTTDLVIGFLEGRLSNTEVKQQLQQRDQLLYLELESSHPLGYFAAFLAELYPDAKFIITIRDPMSWIKSRVNFHYNRQPAEWSKYREYIWSRFHHGYQPEEAVLEQYNLYSIDAYLEQYVEQYQYLMSGIPAERRIIVKTNAINDSVEKINAFIGINEPIEAVVTNTSEHQDNLFEQIPKEFVEQRIKIICSPIKPLLD
jgi:hypothetical protein